MFGSVLDYGNTLSDNNSHTVCVNKLHKRFRFVKITKKNINKFLFILKVDGSGVFEENALIPFKQLKNLKLIYNNTLNGKIFNFLRKKSFINNFKFGFFKSSSSKRLSFSRQLISLSWNPGRFSSKPVSSRSTLIVAYTWGSINKFSLKSLFYTRVTNKKEWSNMKKYSKGLVDGKKVRFAFNYKTRHFTKSNWIFETIPLFFLEQAKGTLSFGHPFHLVNPSILPLTISLSFFCLFQNFLGFMWFEAWNSIYTLGLHSFLVVNLFIVMLTWVLEVYSEEQAGFHTLEVQKGFQYAVLLFILSELMLFISFFWAYFHFSLNSNSYTGGTFIPKGLVSFYWYRIPLLNTLLLLASGLSLSLAHILLIEWDRYMKLKIWIKLLTYHVFEFSNDNLWLNTKLLQHKKTFWSSFQRKSYLIDFRGSWNSMYGIVRTSNDNSCLLPLTYTLKIKGLRSDTLWLPNFWVLDTVIKGFVFLVYQAYEYSSSMFAINDSVYGAVFFSLTGLHGLHVLIGVSFLFSYLVVAFRQAFSKKSYMHGKLFVYADRGLNVKPSYAINFWSHRIAFDGAAWYWHFVDVVWFFVFLFVYWWGFSDMSI